ncbi:hypothetical protein CYMTET_30789 [Cymbomonas tetramitiformis]|uniref:Uncharacterized protein n=1 Tax=Cymbomonas tetramitiformis TaxID=36881 RepID=A0AAE0FJM2_9CHLO|nr:hypothetical protein CYMTET_30789 [Cymbomonas tetramitiformis]
MGGKKGKGGKEKGPVKPDGMSDDWWALYNNPTDLVQNLRGDCALNTIKCILGKTQAAMFLWQHAAGSQAKREEIVALGAIPQAIGALKSVEEHERASCVGLLHCLSTVGAPLKPPAKRNPAVTTVEFHAMPRKAFDTVASEFPVLKGSRPKAALSRARNDVRARGSQRVLARDAPVPLRTPHIFAVCACG